MYILWSACYVTFFFGGGGVWGGDGGDIDVN